MKLTTKGRYAVTAILDLALHEDRGPTNLAHISSRQGISLSYLEQLFSKMRRQDIVKSVRGPGGGYQLSKQKHEISIADIVDSVSESIDATKCQGNGGCQQGGTCLTHHLWLDLSNEIHSFLSSITIEDLVSRKEIIQVSAKQDRSEENSIQAVLSSIEP